MTWNLFFQAIGKFSLGVFCTGLLVFLPAGTLDFPGGQLFMAVLFVPMFCAGLVMMRKAPQLLRSRLQAREKLSRQQLVVKLSGLMFVLGFVLAGLDFRFGWLQLPRWVSRMAAAVLLISYGLYAEVLRENAYLSRTIEVQEGQRVVDTGLYGIVRHPMYAVTLVLFLSIPLVLGSVLALIPFLGYPAILVLRIRSEEQLLLRDLPGYAAYTQKVRWRLLPFLW